MKILFDETKRRHNLTKNGLDFSQLTLDFFETSIVYPARDGRYMALGDFENRTVLAVVFRPLGAEAISVISMRVASRNERDLL